TDGSGVDLQVTAEQPSYLVLTRTVQPGQGKDLAPPEGKLDAGDPSTPPEARALQHDRTDAARPRAPAEFGAPAHHRFGQIRFAERSKIRGRNDLPISKHGGPIAQIEHLAKAMGHIDDGYALGPEPPENREEPLRVAGCQRRRWLVEHQHAGIVGQRL